MPRMYRHPDPHCSDPACRCQEALRDAHKRKPRGTPITPRARGPVQL